MLCQQSPVLAICIPKPQRADFYFMPCCCFCCSVIQRNASVEMWLRTRRSSLPNESDDFHFSPSLYARSKVVLKKGPLSVSFRQIAARILETRISCAGLVGGVDSFFLLNSFIAVELPTSGGDDSIV